MRTIRACALITTVVLAGACGELPSEQSAAATEPLPEPAAILEAAAELPAPQASTICEAHRDQLADLRSRVAGDPANATLGEQVHAYQTIVAATCD